MEVYLIKLPDCLLFDFSDEVKFYYLYSPSVRHAENFTRYGECTGIY